MFRETARYARFYQSLGWNPIPSRADIKGPALRSGDVTRYRDGEPIPGSWTEEEHWWSSNLQLACGVPWRLMVVDLDGALARILWRRWARSCGASRTWTVRTGGGGIHLYYRLPSWLPACPTRKVWGIWDPAAKPKPGWVKHQEIKLLADRALAIAPPSIHVETKQPYRFSVGPRDIPRPAPVPSWLLGMAEIQRPKPASRGAPRTPSIPRRRPLDAKHHDWREVLGRLDSPRRLELAAGWGLRLAVGAGVENAAGWVSCHAVGREDRNPSASFHPATGVYWEPGFSIGFFALAAALEAYSTWQEACDALGDATP